MIFKYSFTARLLSLALATCPLFAAAQAQEEDAFFQKLTQKYPGANGSKVAPAFPGFHSVVQKTPNGTEILFISDDLGFVIKGDVTDLSAGRSLTQALKDANQPILDVASLDLKNAIAFGSGANSIYVFSDPDCPFCKRLESELAALKDVTVYIFPFPLIQIHPNAQRVSESIWCSKDRQKAWRDYVLDGRVPTAQACATPIQANLIKGQEFQIMGTPTIIFQDGTFAPGAIKATQILEKINPLASKAAKS